MIKLTAGIILWTVVVATNPNVKPLTTSTLSIKKKIEILDKSETTLKRRQDFFKNSTDINEDPAKPENDFDSFIKTPTKDPSICDQKDFLYKKIDPKSDSPFFTTNGEDLKWQNISINNVPFWIRPRLLLTLNEIKEEKATDLINHLSKISENKENLKFLDELFFVIAFSSPIELEQEDFSPEMIVQNIKTLYASSSVLDYAQIVEKGTEITGELTTVSLKIKDGDKITDVELDPWLYYAFIVHPRLDNEIMGSFNPSENTFTDIDNGGTDFRTNFFYGEPASQSYSGHYIFRNDWNIDTEKLQMPDGNFSCPVVFSAKETDQLGLITSSLGACMTETFFGTGNIVAIGLDMESIDNKLTLSNFINYGNGYCSLKGKTILILENETSAEFLRKNIEFYLSDYQYVLIDDLNDEILFTTTEENGNTSYTLNAGKVIISPSMSDASYSKISDMKDSFDTFASKGGSVMMLLYSADSNPCSFDLPGGIKCSKNSGGTEDFKLSGHPILKDHLQNTKFYYEKGVKPYYLEGEIPLNKNAGAIEKTGDWIGLNMPRNISEMNNTSEKVERAVQAVRIAYNHYGNCGENQDISGAAMKTALIPVININNSAEDHVWNEIWTPDGWMSMQSAWSNYSQDYGTVGKICMEKKFEGGKDISYVYAWRGDHSFFNRTSTYTDTVTTHLTVLDSEDNGVPDAAILIATESYYDTSQLTIAGSTSTNKLGEATIVTGDSRNIYIQIVSDSLGVFPGIQKVEKIISSENAKPDSEFEYTAKFNIKLPQPIEVSITSTNNPEGEHEVTVDLIASQYISHTNPFNEGKVFKALDGLSGNVHIFEEEQFENFKESKSAVAVTSIKVQDLPITIKISEEKTYYAVFTPEANTITAGELIIETAVEKIENDDDETNDDSDKKSDGCSVIFI